MNHYSYDPKTLRNTRVYRHDYEAERLNRAPAKPALKLDGLLRKFARTIALLAFVAFLAHAQTDTVYVTAHGKTFHKSKDCMSLSHSSAVFPVTREKAEAHGLKPCGMCYRVHKTAPDWTKEVKP
jgi:hypothetical protein